MRMNMNVNWAQLGSIYMPCCHAACPYFEDARTHCQRGWRSVAGENVAWWRTLVCQQYRSLYSIKEISPLHYTKMQFKTASKLSKFSIKLLWYSIWQPDSCSRLEDENVSILIKKMIRARSLEILQFKIAF